MTVSLKHTFTSPKDDSADPTVVQPSNWNEEHELTLATDKLLGRATAGTGAAEEIGIGTALSVSGGTLAVTNVPVANGGTGASTLTGYVKGNGTSAFTASASVPVGDLSGTLPVASGGTGATTLTANNVLIGNGTSAVTSVAPGILGNVLTSDGTNWISNTPSSGPIGGFQYFAGTTSTTYPGSQWLLANGSLVLQASYPELYSKLGLFPNGGVVWTSRNTPTTGQIYALTYGNNTFVYGGQNGNLGTSTDAITWTARTSGTGGFDISALTYGNALFVLGSGNGLIRTSTDAITWTTRTSGTSSSILALIYSGTIFVAAGVGGAVCTSTDAITWTPRTSGTAENINALTYGNGVYVAAGGNGMLITSTNAITWTTRTPGASTNTLLGLAYGNGGYVLVGTGSTLRTSTDAITWTTRTGTGTQLRGVVYSKGLYAYVGDSGVLATSADAITWTARTSGASNVLYAIAEGNNTLFYGGMNAFATDDQLGTSPLYTYNPATEFLLPTVTGNLSTPYTSPAYIKAL